MPFVRPVTVIGEPELVAVCPRLEVTVYEVIDAPPLLTGGIKLIVACPFPLVAVTPDGASGIVDGVATPDAVEFVPVPDTFIAATLKV